MLINCINNYYLSLCNHWPNHRQQWAIANKCNVAPPTRIHPICYHSRQLLPTLGGRILRCTSTILVQNTAKKLMTLTCNNARSRWISHWRSELLLPGRQMMFWQVTVSLNLGHRGQSEELHRSCSCTHFLILRARIRPILKVTFRSILMPQPLISSEWMTQ